MELGFRQEQRLSQKMELSLKLERKLSLTLITPQAICPECDHEMNDNEIRQGWNDDPLDITTQCPNCGHRFNAFLILENRDSGFEATYDYLCPEQLFYQLKQLIKRTKRKALGKVFLDQKAPHLLFNIIRHFGMYERGIKAFNKRR